MGNAGGLQMDGFSAHFDSSGSSFGDFHDFDEFASVSDGLTLFPEGPRTLRDCPEGPGNLWECAMEVSCCFRKAQTPPRLSLRSRDPLRVSYPTSRNSSGLVWTSRNLVELGATYRDLSQLVATPVALRAGAGTPISKDLQA